MIDQQSAARSTSSSKQHNLIFASCVPTRPLALGRQTITTTEPGTTTTKQHAILQRVFSGKKNTKNVTMRYGTKTYATHWFLPWILSTFTATFVWRSLTAGGVIIFPLTSCVENVWYTLASCQKICRRQEAYCVWSYSYVPTSKYIACTRVQTMSICPNLYNTTLGAPGTQPLAMLLSGFFWGSNRNHYYYYYLLLVLVMRPLATSISMYVHVRVPIYRNSINKCTTMIPTTIPWRFLLLQ